MRKAAFLGFGGFFCLLGLVGVVLPGIPATPFFLLTSYFLVRSSPRLNAALLRSRVIGPILTDWQVHGGVRPNVKLKAISSVVVVVGLTVYLSTFSVIPILIVVLFAGIGITVISNRCDVSINFGRRGISPVRGWR
ncbi:MAG: YbaN family protein [Planctomycetales bacterium]